jgi:hypothetical protein
MPILSARAFARRVRPRDTSSSSGPPRSKGLRWVTAAAAGVADEVDAALAWVPSQPFQWRRSSRC